MIKKLLSLVLISLLLSPVNALATWVHVQSNGTAGTTSQASRGLAFASNPAAGSFIVVGGAVWDGGSVPTSVSVTDSLSTSYTCLHDDIGGGDVREFLCYGTTTSSGANTVTVDPEGSAFISFGIAEFTGPDSTPLDADGGVTDNAGTPGGTNTTDSITTISANALIIAVFSVENYSGNSAITPNAEMTDIAEATDGGSLQPFNTSYRIATSATSYDVTYTYGASCNGTPTCRVRTASFETGAAAAVSKKRVVIIQ